MLKNRSIRRTVPRLAPVLFIALLVGCSGGGGGSTSTTSPPSAHTLKSIAVTTSKPEVAAGLTSQFKATATYSDSGVADVTNSVTWTSASPAVATIDAQGLATTKTQGSVLISATSSGITGSATLSVDAAALLSIQVKAATVQLGSNTQMVATGTYTDQSTHDLSSSAAWSTTNHFVATVDPSGVLTSSAAGQSSITATLSGMQAKAAVTVLASPRYLYVAGLAGRTLTRMPVDAATGKLRFEGFSYLYVPQSVGFPCMTVDPSGTHAYLTNQTLASGGTGYAGTVQIYSIESATGAMTALPGSPYAVPFALGCVRFNPSGKVAYAITGIENAGDLLGTFSVNSDGTLSLKNTVAFPLSASSLAVDPRGATLYVSAVDVAAGLNGKSQLFGFTIDQSTGALTAIESSPWSLPDGTYALLSFEPMGNNLYASDLNNKNILQLAIARDTGVPTLAATVDSSCINPSALQFLTDGSHAYSLCGESSNRSVTQAPIIEFTVAENGLLTVHSSAFAGPVARQMQVDEAARFLYVLGTGSDAQPAGAGSTNVAMNTVLAYRVQPDGSLKLTEESAGHVIAESMVLVSGPAPVSWKSANAYATTAGDNKVTGYTVAPDGNFSQANTVSTSAGPFSADVLPWGSDLLFATTSASQNLYAYAAPGGVISTGTAFGPSAPTAGIAIDPRGNFAYAVNSSTGAVDVYQQGIPGFWWLSSANQFNAAPGASAITMDPSGRYILVANATAKTLSLFEPLGAAATPAISLAYAPLAVTFSATGKLVFVAGGDGKLHMLSSNGLGTLTEIAAAPLVGQDTVSIAADPVGRAVYAAGPSGTNAFAVDATAGTLKPITVSASFSLTSATGVFVDPSGSYAYVAVSSSSTNALYQFTIQADGSLLPSREAPVSMPSHLTSMTFRAIVQ